MFYTRKKNIRMNMKFTIRMRFAWWRKNFCLFLIYISWDQFSYKCLIHYLHEFCGVLPATLGSKSVHLLIPTTILNHWLERGRMTVNAVHSEGQVRENKLESESVDLVASVLKIMSGVSITMFPSLPVPRGSSSGDTAERSLMGRYSTDKGRG